MSRLSVRHESSSGLEPSGATHKGVLTLLLLFSTGAWLRPMEETRAN